MNKQHVKNLNTIGAKASQALQAGGDAVDRAERAEKRALEIEKKVKVICNNIIAIGWIIFFVGVFLNQIAARFHIQHYGGVGKWQVFLALAGLYAAWIGNRIK